MMQLVGQLPCLGMLLVGCCVLLNAGLQDRMYCIDRCGEFLKFITFFEMNFYLLLACNRNLCSG